MNYHNIIKNNNGKSDNQNQTQLKYFYDISHVVDIEFNCSISYNVLIEQELMKCEIIEGVESPQKFELQALYEDDTSSPSYKNYMTFMKYFAKASQYYKKTISEFMDIDTFEECCDKLAHLYGWYTKCKDPDDYVRLSMLAYQFITGRFAHRDLFKYISNKYFPSNLQANEGYEFLKYLRSNFDKAKNLQNTEIYKKLTAMYSYLLVHGILERFGMKITDEDYTKIEQKALFLNYSSKKEMWICILDTTLFICEKLYEYKISGDVSVFVHSSDEYSKWLTKADKLLALAPFTSNLKAHGTTYFTFVSDLNDTIEKGEAYAKYTMAHSGVDCVSMKRKLFSLQLLKNTDITRRAAQKERQAPFGVLIHGRSSVAKSSFTKLMYYYYASLHGLDKDDHFRYVRNPADEYWTGCDSSKWCIQMDDISFLNPSKTSEADPTLMEMLNVVNNVPYVPPQAALEDKGKTPILAELVLATSNAIDLNAHAYFWCPLAIQRRLPFVISIEPKAEYKHENQVFIDPVKLTIASGEFPDYWNITLHKIVPYFDGQRDKATLEVTKVFTDINEFLKEFGDASMKHKSTQNNADKSDENVKNISVCPLCMYNTTKCKCTLQSNNSSVMGFISSKICIYVTLFFAFIFDILLKIKLFYKFQIYCAKYRLLRKCIIGLFFRYYPIQTQMKLLGEINNIQSSTTKWKKFIGIFGLFVMVTTLTYKLYTASKSSSKEKDSEFDNIDPVFDIDYESECDLTQEEIDVVLGDNIHTSDVVEEHCESSYTEYLYGPKKPLDVQGNMYCTVESQLEKEQRQNVWYNDHIELTKFDLPLSSQSLVGKNDEQLAELFMRNCVHLDIEGHGQNAYKTMKIGGIFIKGHFCITNNHAFKYGCDRYVVKLTQHSVADGLNSNVVFELKANDIIRNSTLDFCLFEVENIPPMKDLLKFWIEKPVHIATLLMLKRNKNGCMHKHIVHNAQLIQQFPVETLDIKLPIMLGKTVEMTAKGDCGSLAIAKTPVGVAVTGMHMLGYEDQCGISVLTRDDINSCITRFHDKFTVFEVQGGGKPSLECSSKKHVLDDLHPRSMFRYIPKGVVNLYGTFAGFRPRPRSRVTDTPLTNELLEYYGVEQGYDKPQMSGWTPWRNNVMPMIEPKIQIDKDILEECVNSFTTDILNGLPDEWEKQLLFLSDLASVNGLPGVIYVDKLNSNTSMGFPWNESKKKHLESFESDVYPKGVNFDTEIWDRVNSIKEKYNLGQRSYPVFMGHLKDEATPLEKCKIGKTRLFTGAPVDWSLVVRSRLLTFVRLLQNNKFLFEAGPGTVCQSREWGKIYEYLTHFGVEQMVAGDYSKFDKKMSPQIILAAFKIICNIYKRAGFSENEVREIACIGEDIAYPIVNVDGCLVEFFGTNPSGHPLTVIINSLVNSLYMRIAYYLCNPRKECYSFKQNVRLFTYGDDNIMGVSKKAPWFNHTAIQKLLETIGVDYTMADKETESIPYIDIRDCSFLKRKWHFCEELQTWLCPLDEKSIIKSLTKWVPSKTLGEHAQMVAIISSANSEYFFHGKEIFELRHKKFKEILSREPYSFYVNESTLPTWHELKARFEVASSSLNL